MYILISGVEMSPFLIKMHRGKQLSSGQSHSVVKNGKNQKTSKFYKS